MSTVDEMRVPITPGAVKLCEGLGGVAEEVGI